MIIGLRVAEYMKRQVLAWTRISERCTQETSIPADSLTVTSIDVAAPLQALNTGVEIVNHGSAK